MEIKGYLASKEAFYLFIFTQAPSLAEKRGAKKTFVSCQSYRCVGAIEYLWNVPKWNSISRKDKWKYQNFLLFFSDCCLTSSTNSKSPSYLLLFGFFFASTINNVNNTNEAASHSEYFMAISLLIKLIRYRNVVLISNELSDWIILVW